MDDKLQAAILAASDANTLADLIRAHALDLETVHALGKASSRFYFDRPAQALRLAEAAFRLGGLLPFPAPARGHWTLANALLEQEVLNKEDVERLLGIPSDDEESETPSPTTTAEQKTEPEQEPEIEKKPSIIPPPEPETA